MKRRARSASHAVVLSIAIVAASCAPEFEPAKADLILRNARVYTFTWEDPAPDGTPADDAPYDEGGWRPDASAIGIEGGTILFVGGEEEAEAHRAEHTRVVDLGGATVLPGLVDAHTHVANLGAVLEQVDLVGVESEEEAVERVAARAVTVPAGEWIVGYGWDEGAWADHYPDLELLSRRAPDHPVVLRGLHGFAVWGNRMALERAGIGPNTQAPPGGRILRDAARNPTGVFVDRATTLLTDAIPAPPLDRIEARVVAALDEMARGGYTAVHEAGVDARLLAALESLAAAGRLPLRVYAMLSASEQQLLADWIEWGPDTDGNDRLMTRSVKAFYDGALGSRGARLLEDYSDLPGHRGAAGEEYGFDEELLARMAGAGFQIAVHAIGDAGNREALDFFQRLLEADPAARRLRHRIEHAQVVHPDDMARFAELDVIASMQPPHAMEDKAWAEQRIGPERILTAYAWRALRQAGARLVFSSDLPGSDHDIFYGLHSAVARQDRQGQPEGGWYAGQRMTPEEALRGYTGWAAWSSLLERSAGSLRSGMWADLTVMGLDPLVVGSTDPGQLLSGAILMTLVGGEIVYEQEVVNER